MDLCNGVDREKVTTGLECCQKTNCDECPYVYEGLTNCIDCTADLTSDALALLEESEPIVRCKDCKHQCSDRFYKDSIPYVLCGKGHGWKPDDWFCADGEEEIQEWKQ